jgi:hypothetical protein
MTVQHVNRKGQTYYLHQGQTKSGKPKYYFSMKAERFCFLGSIDDWINISPLDSLEELVRQFVPHLGQHSFYDLY